MSKKLTKKNLYDRKWRKNNQDKVIAYRELYYKTPTGRFRKYKEGAKMRGHNFEIEFNRFNLLLNQNCHYCGKKKANGIDRIDNSKGYIQDNVLSCCRTCNFMKMAHSYDSFIEHIKSIYKNLLKRK